MNVSHLVGVLAISLAVGALGVGAEVFHESRQEGPPSAPVTTADGAEGGRNAPLRLRASVPDQPCEVAAVPVLDDVDPRLAETALTNPASQADPTGPSMYRDGALAAARQLSEPFQSAADAGQSLPALDQYPAVALRVPFRVADDWMPGESSDGSLVAPGRCIWLVTVHAPFVPLSSPDPDVASRYDKFTAMYDLASGEFLGVSAGSDIPDLISGAGVGVTH